MEKSDVPETQRPGSASGDSQDPEIQVEKAQLQRGLGSRHLQFIALGGTLGTGIFLGTGSALAMAGPVGCLLSYIFVGTLVYSVMTSLGEMATYMPVAGSFTVYASRFVDPALGFAMGWIYWFSWAVTYALELTAAGLIIQYWHSGLNIGIFIAVFWVVFTTVNFLPVSIYGELELWFVSIKVVTIIGFIIYAICVDAGVGQQGYLGFHNWVHPGPFAEYLHTGSAGRFIGFWAVLIKAGFSYQGTELVGVGAGETDDPKKNVPKAIRNTFWGVLALFISTVFFIGLLVPYDNADLLGSGSDATASPFVIAANLAGTKVLPDIINGVLLTAVLSAANANVYSGSRILIALANEKQAPACFARTSRQGIPYWAVAFTAAFGLLGFLNLSASGGEVFNWLLNITGVAGFITWACINISHLRFMSVLASRGIPRNILPYLAPFQPYLSYYGLFFNLLIILTQGFTAFIPWNTTDFFIAYVSPILFVVLYAGHKLLYRHGLVPLEEVDLVTGRIGDESHDEPIQTVVR